MDNSMTEYSDKSVINEVKFSTKHPRKCKGIFYGMRKQNKFIDIGLNIKEVTMAGSVNIESKSVFKSALKRKVKPVMLPGVGSRSWWQRRRRGSRRF